MKLFDNIFWGVLFIFIGVILILKYLFHLNIPVGRVVVAFFLVYCGIIIAFGGRIYSQNNGGNMIFNSGEMNIADKDSEYNIIFSSGTVDLTSTPVKSKKIEINCVFSKGTVIIGRDMPVVVKANSAFGATNLPDNTSISFGEHTYSSGGYTDSSDCLIIETNSVFGQLDIVREK